MNGTALQLALRELRAHFTDPRTLGVLAVASILLGFAGPFGTFEVLPLVPRIVYWTGTVWLTYATGFGLSVVSDELFTARGPRPFWQRFVVMVLPTALGTTLVAAIVNMLAFGVGQLELDPLLRLFSQCLAVTIGVVTVVLLLQPAQAAPAEAASPGPPSAGPPPVLERVPLAQRGKLLALVVEDHYVDIVTDRGKTLVLMRLADAMRETGDIEGLQVHRSHWVAREAVVKAVRTDGKLLLELSNGMRLPVSRGFAARVKEAGLA